MDFASAGFCVVEQLFVELFARAQSGELDVDVLGEPQSGEHDDVLGQIDDLDRFTHVENQHVSAGADGAGLNHQLNSFGDRHEKPLHVGVSDRDGATRFDLFSKGRNDAAHRVEDVPESNRDEPGSALARE